MHDVGSNRLDRDVDPRRDHILGPPGAGITLVEYGSYACPYCRAANEHIAEARAELGDRLRYVFRHRPLSGSDIARRAAELVETVKDDDAFWRAHETLMTRSATLTEDDLRVVAAELGRADDLDTARARVEEDERSARASGVLVTPTFYMNGRRYDGPWDESSFADAMLGTLGHRVRAAALDFAAWAPSAGLLLLAATLLAVALSNSPLGAGFESFWHAEVGLVVGGAEFRLSLLHWINDGLLTVFFLVVGLEIKREFTVGHLASPRAAALPIAAALGGMAAPALVYAALIPSGPWAHGWGVPMATDTAFAVALVVILGARVPVELRIFLTAAAIVDDIGAIVVVALFYSDALHLGALAAAAAMVAGLVLLNHWRVYWLTPYVLVGFALWFFVHESGLHATLAGVLLALFIPTRPPADLKALVAQATSILNAETRRSGEALHGGPSLPALRSLDAIHDRLESPADRLLRRAGARSSYLVLPLFALANAGVAVAPAVIAGREQLMLAIVAGLAVGKPLGILAASAVAVRMRLAVKPDAYSWRQLAGAGALAGIGFTMSLFIAGQAFADAGDFAAAKLAVFAGSILAAIAGTALLWSAAAPEPDPAATPQAAGSP
jgi:NhaA family Na+:H+ antiporter